MGSSWQLQPLGLCCICIYIYIYIIFLKERERPSPDDSISQGWVQLRPGARTPSWYLSGARHLSIWAIICYLPRNACRKLGWKLSSWDSNGHFVWPDGVTGCLSNFTTTLANSILSNHVFAIICPSPNTFLLSCFHKLVSFSELVPRHLGLAVSVPHQFHF